MRPKVLTTFATGSNAVKYFVAKLVKSFGGLGNAAESLDDFRYVEERPG